MALLSDQPVGINLFTRGRLCRIITLSGDVIMWTMRRLGWCRGRPKTNAPSRQWNAISFAFVSLVLKLMMIDNFGRLTCQIQINAPVLLDLLVHFLVTYSTHCSTLAQKFKKVILAELLFFTFFLNLSLSHIFYKSEYEIFNVIIAISGGRKAWYQLRHGLGTETSWISIFAGNLQRMHFCLVVAL